MARLVASTIKKNDKIVKRRLFAPYFGITFSSFVYKCRLILEAYTFSPMPYLNSLSVSEDRGQMTEDRW
jgi:hypothetical protein